MDFIAHIRESDRQIQTVEEHLLEAKEIAETYGEKIGVKYITGLAGMLHDLGKYTNEFMEYILEAVSNPNSSLKRGSVDHSTAGGKFLYEVFHIPTKNFNRYKGLVAEVVGNAIISHHSYLQDFLNPSLESNYLNRVRDKELPGFNLMVQNFFEKVIGKKEFQEYVDKAAIELEDYLAKEPAKESEKQLMFLTKFVFSVLIDADRTNTRLFEENKTEELIQDNSKLFNDYYERLMLKLNSLKNQNNSDTSINQLRREMSEQCEKFADKPSGIYTLSIPTGGGKTLASLRYALKHAKLHNKNRIIYVVPFTTIIEQNAQEIREILKDNVNILEHHSNVVEDVNDDDENQDAIIDTQQKLKLAKDNWNSPIIFTTMVQFLNVFYAKGSRNIRRLHNLSNSVIIFDEVQKVPTKCVSLFNYALNFLKTYCHCSILLCTATQPALDFVEHKLEIDSNAEIIEELDRVTKAFKRIEIIDRATKETFNNEKLAEFIWLKIREVQSVLIILNTKTVVRDLYEKLKIREDNVPVYHLSTAMCAAHRVKILDEIRSHLKKNNKIICISTQLIEAGVDVSFNCVIRSLAGLDSIAQAAGRCNRHGEHNIQKVYVIDHENENLDRLKEIKAGKRISKKILIDIHNNKTNHGGNILSKQAMERYFSEYYTDLKQDLNYSILDLGKDMIKLLCESKRDDNSYYRAYTSNKGAPLPLFIANSYKTAAEKFWVIDDNTTSVIVPYEGGKEVIAELNSNSTIDDLTWLLKRAQQYTINLYAYEQEQLEKNDGLMKYIDGRILALKEGAYSEEFGLNLENNSQLELNMY